MWGAMQLGQIFPPSLADLEAISRAALARLPEQFKLWLAPVVFSVEEFPDADTCAELGLESPFDVLGLYRGRPVGEKFSDISGALPDMIHLYRRPILDYWVETGEALDDVVIHVLIHEVGHHFGLSDADMDRIEAELDQSRS
jgi:predicted Zn-dependent protease with MMP-like domain